MKNTFKKTAIFYVLKAWQSPSRCIGVLLAVPLTVLLGSYIPPLIIASVLSKLSTGNYVPADIWPVFGPQLVGYVLLLLAGIAAWRLVDFFAWRLEAKVQQSIAQQVFNHLMQQTLDFHSNRFSGSLVSQSNKLLGGYIRVSDTTIFQTYPLLVGLIFTNIILAGSAPLFVIVLDIFAVLFLYTAFRVAKPVVAASRKFATTESRQTGYLADAIANVATVKSYARIGYENRRFKAMTDATQKDLRSFARVHQKQMNRLGFLSRAISGAALTLAVVAVVVFKADLGVMFLILTYTTRIVEGLFDFSNSGLRNYARALGDAADMVTILNEPPAIMDPIKPTDGKIADGSINFKAVTFTHAGATKPLFKKLNLNIKQGEKVGLVGHSGSGKTTLTRILLRFSDITDGEIIVGGQDIAQLKQVDLHENIAYVPQEPLLFHRTIAENIAYARPKATDEEIKAAADNAHASEFIDLLPSTYETLVGERGIKLSGGQRQRIAIARAMLKDAPILVLDEATSALDSASEVLIQDALWKLMQGRTAIVIAHRLSTIQKMDRIIVLDKGAIIESGTHQELLAKGKVYATLWAHQSGGFLEE